MDSDSEVKRTMLACLPVLPEAVEAVMPDSCRPAAGSGRGRCSCCGGDVWVSPDGQWMLLRMPTLVLLCLECWIGVWSLRAQRGASTTVVPMEEIVRPGETR